MSSTILITVVSLFLLALAAAVILYIISQKFKVDEDPRIDLVQAELPGANCGGCGFAGCRAFAEATVSAADLSECFCPVGGAEAMGKIAAILGKTAVATEPKVAVLLCNGSPEYRKKSSNYDGVHRCSIEHNLYAGDTDCSFGCLGYGDCAEACSFGGITIDPITHLPIINENLCVACGTCVKACPRHLIELRKRAPKDRKIYVACSNCDKGAVAKRACSIACIGCGKCVKVCQYDAISVANNLAYIDSFKCKMCRKCVEVCPQHSILEIGFPLRKAVAVSNENKLTIV